MVKMTFSLWCAVFVRVMFSKEIWFSWLYFLLYGIIAYGYTVNPEVTWERVGIQAGALLFIAFIFSMIVGISNIFNRNKLI